MNDAATTKQMITPTKQQPDEGKKPKACNPSATTKIKRDTPEKKLVSHEDVTSSKKSLTSRRRPISPWDPNISEKPEAQVEPQGKKRRRSAAEAWMTFYAGQQCKQGNFNNLMV